MRALRSSLVWVGVVSMLLGSAFASDASALIVVDGKIVSRWPESSQQFDIVGAAPQRFFSNPQGHVRGVTLLVDFSDQSPAFDKQEIADWLNTQ